jgi:hypothetical protein
MSDNFTYQPPNTEKYLQVLLKLLLAKGEVALYDLLKNSCCEIDASSSFSRVRWNALYTSIYFYVPTDDFNKLNIDDETKTRLIGYCDSIMPKTIGFDVMHVEISPSIETEFTNGKSLEEDLEEFSHSFGETEIFYIPDDVLAKGKEMMKVYLYLYAVENYIRLFVEQVCLGIYGQDYFTKLTLTKSIKDTITGRKRSEEKNGWVSIRGDTDLFYLDFIELNALIQSNWEIFKDYFPDQSWINAKLNELYCIRNLVAHNSYVGEHERNILQVYFRSIVKQLNASQLRLQRTGGSIHPAQGESMS